MWSCMKQPPARGGAECKIGVTLSLGVAVTEIMRLPEADTALYRAKANGRNRVEVADAHVSSAARVSS